MVSPFTLGLFAPLPLAMMIPFMATQSLAMGEAFGKSFQYGKRKISSMTNEEFNKLTFSDLMEQQTANIKILIPKLAQQMEDSNVMQEKVFQEMTKLIPAFIKGLSAGTQDIITENPGINLKTIAPAPLGLPVAVATNWDDVKQAIISLAKITATSMIGFQHVAKATVTSTPATQGPIQESPPTNTFQNIQDIQKQLDEGTLKQPPTPDLYSHQPPPATADQLRRQSITESGLSPLAYASREKFKTNIDNNVAYLEAIQKDLTLYRKHEDGRVPSLGSVSQIYISRIPAQEELVKKAVAKLSALRIKYRSVYGVYY